MTALDSFVLAGGRSSRMGEDKARLTLDGRSMLERIVDAVRPVARRIVLVGRASELGLAAVPDARIGFGPLAGIEAALASCETRAAIVLACDLPFVSTALLDRLLDRAGAEPDAVVVAEDFDGRVAPLCGVYPVSTRASVTRLLDAGERRPRALENVVPYVRLAFDAYASLPNAKRLLRNVNTPEDLDSARSIVE